MITLRITQYVVQTTWQSLMLTTVRTAAMIARRGDEPLAAGTRPQAASKALPAAEWLDDAKTARKLPNDRLADSGNLSGPHLLGVIKQLKDIAARIQQFEKAAGAGASCAISVGSNHDASVVVSLGTDGKLVVSCQ